MPRVGSDDRSIEGTTSRIPAGTYAFFDTRADVWGYRTGDPARAARASCAFLVNGVETGPTELEYVAEQDPFNGNSNEGQWMIERSSGMLDPGSYMIKVQHGAAGREYLLRDRRLDVTNERVTV